MDDESRQTILGRTEFWVILTVVITFAGCIMIINSALDIESLLVLKENITSLTQLLDKMDIHMGDILESLDKAPVVVTATPEPVFALPTVTP